MRSFQAILIALLVVIAGACTSSETANTAPNSKTAPAQNENPDNRVDEENPGLGEAPGADNPDAKASRSQIEAKDAAQTGLGPTDTMRAFYDAIIKKDGPKARSFLSRASIKLVEDAARREGVTVDQILTAEEEGVSQPTEREFRNETVDGDNASIEEKNIVFGRYDKMYLVREDGNWRVALDKIQAEAIRKFNEMQKDAPEIEN